MLLSFALAACAGGTVTGEYHGPFYTPELTALVSSGGVMPTAVYGAPYDAAGIERLLDGLEMPGRFQPARFVDTPAARAGEGGRVVLVFDPAPVAADGIDACRLRAGDAPPRAPAGGTMRVLVAFCHGGGLASESTATLPRRDRAADATTVAAINGALSRTLRSDDPSQRDGCGGDC